jgi:NitT/TauT family transport system permease protein
MSHDTIVGSLGRDSDVESRDKQDSAPTPPGGVTSSRWFRPVARIAAVVIGLVVWQLASGAIVDQFYLPEPTEVWAELSEWIRDGSLWSNILATIVPAIQGFVIGSVVAFVLGYILAMMHVTADVFEPFIATMYGVPIIALIPLMILWFGIGDTLAVAVTAVATFFLMFYNAYFGIRDVTQSLIDQVSIAGGSRWDIAVRVRIPSALVWVVAGMKIAVPHALVGVVVTEFLTGSEGLGFLLARNASQFNSAGTFAAVFTLASISFLLDRSMFLFTRRALMWKEANKHA